MKFKFTADGYQPSYDKFCSFGITEVIVAGSILEAAVGTTVATALVGAGLGAGVGAAMSAATGGNPLTGALTGGLTGGIGGIAGAAGEAAGIGSTAGQTLGGMASGALSAGITGGNPLTSAALGGAQAFGAAALNGGLDSNTSQANPDPNAAPAAPASSSTTPTAGGDSLSSVPVTPGGMSTPLTPGGMSTPTGALTPGQQVSQAIGSEGGGISTPVASTPDASSPSWFSQAKDYIMGSGTPSQPVTTMADAAKQAQSSGNFAVFTDAKGNPIGTVGANGAISSMPAGTAGATTPSGGIGSKILNNIVSNPLQTGLLGLQMYTQMQHPSTPPTIAQQQASTQPAGWNSPLPQYQYNSVRNPVANYYTYGYSPQSPQIVNTLTPQPSSATMKTGGKVQRLATGGVPTPHIPKPRVMSARPSGFAALGAMAHARSQQGAPSGGSPPVSLGALSMARGGQTFAKQGQVQMGTGTSGTADKVPAMLSEDEYVLPADVTSHLGNGSSNAGGKVLDKFVQNVRAQRGVKSKGLPPSAKSPEQYIGK